MSENTSNDIFSDFDETDEDTKELVGLYRQLKQRCDNAGLNFGLVEEGYALFDLPSGKNKREVYAGDVKYIKDILSADFEEYGFIDSYEAIYSYKNDVIEARLRSLRSGLSQIEKLQRLFRTDLTKNISHTSINLSRERNGSLQTITIGKISGLLTALSDINGPSIISLKLHGFGISQHDQTKALLEQIASTIFYHLDVNNDISLALQREHKIRFIMGNRFRKETAPLIFPQTIYPKEPMALYWYARSAERMPLLQFLAYYQAIEYFFPIYSEGDAKKRVQNLLKAPDFSIHSDADIMRLLAVVKSNMSRGYGDEKSQLKVTLEATLDNAELKKFITQDQERSVFLTTDKTLVSTKLLLAKPDADLRTDVANRLYEIRCKIVHTKAGGDAGEVDLLLPFSKEAELLEHDIDLARYIAQQVINANGRELTI